jgi:hypothetical protein
VTVLVARAVPDVCVGTTVVGEHAMSEPTTKPAQRALPLRVIAMPIAAVSVAAIVVVPILAIVWGPRAIWFLETRPVPPRPPEPPHKPCMVSIECDDALTCESGLIQTCVHQTLDAGTCWCTPDCNSPDERWCTPALREMLEAHREFNAARGMECDPDPRDGGVGWCHPLPDGGRTRRRGGRP